MENKEFQTENIPVFPFDPIVVVMDVCRRWLLILALAAVVGVGSYILTDAAYAPVYRASATVVVTTRDSATTVYSNLDNTITLASVFDEILNSSEFRRIIREETDLAEFTGSISARVVPDTNLLLIHVNDRDPRSAFLMMEAVLNNHRTITEKIVEDVVVEVLQPPTVPSYPANSVSPMGRMRQMMLITAGAACVVLAWHSMTRDAVRSDNEARRKMKTRYLGSVPHERKYRTVLSFLRHRKAGILVSSPATSFRFLEAVRKLRRRVEQQLHGRKTLMITSFLENEGKSTVAVNLAMMMAKKHKRVLLMECDLRKPACYMILGQQQSTAPGVRDVLRGRAAPEDALIRDSRSGLYMMLEKKGGRDSGDLIGSARMREVLDWARENFDLVILDLPPMAAVTDAEAMTDLAEASLLVVRQNMAPTPVLNRAVTALERGSAKLLGCALNNVYSTRAFSGQGHGYGYGYGYGYGGYRKYGYYKHYGYGHYGHYGKNEDSGE